jgi:DNA-directed RNA polymerase beta subunit
VGRASRIDQDLPLLWARITAPVMASSARDTKGDRHMAQTFLGQKRLRKYYGKIREVLEMPNLIEVQKSSYDLFLRSGDAETPTDGDGIQGVFQSRTSTRRRCLNTSSTSSKNPNTMSRNVSNAT